MADGKPASGANVTAQSAAAGAGYANATTAEDGSFTLSGLAAGRYDLTASLADVAQGSVSDVDVSKATDITIRLLPPTNATITGTVAGTDARVLVEATNAAGDRRQGVAEPSGKYVLTNVPTGVVTVSARMIDRLHSRNATPVTIDVAPNSTTEVALVFAEQVAISGRVTLNDAPLAGARVAFEGPDTSTVVTGEGGLYSNTLAPGHYTIRINAPQLPSGYTTERDIAAGTPADIAVVTNSVTVTVVDSAAGTPVDHARVSGSGAHAQAFGNTSSNGQVTIAVPVDTKQITIEKDGYATAFADVKGSAITVPLTRADAAVVRILDARDGRTLSGYTIARDDAGRVIASSSQTGGDGSERLPLLPGKYRFSASAPEYGSQTVIANVPSGEIRIALPRGGKLALQSRVPMTGTARLIEPDGEEYVRCWCSGIATIAIGGRMTLVDSIAPGPYALEIALSGAKPRRIPVTVIEGETTTVNIDQ